MRSQSIYKHTRHMTLKQYAVQWKEDIYNKRKGPRFDVSSMRDSEVVSFALTNRTQVFLYA